jgi:hypothetical protein
MAEEIDKDLLAAYQFVDSMVSRADGHVNGFAPWWHGWALREAWLAGVKSGKGKQMSIISGKWQREKLIGLGIWLFLTAVLLANAGMTAVWIERHPRIADQTMSTQFDPIPAKETLRICTPACPCEPGCGCAGECHCGEK